MRRIERTARHHHDALKSIGARNDAVRVPTTLRARVSDDETDDRVARGLGAHTDARGDHARRVLTASLRVMFVLARVAGVGRLFRVSTSASSARHRHVRRFGKTTTTANAPRPRSSGVAPIVSASASRATRDVLSLRAQAPDHLGRAHVRRRRLAARAQPSDGSGSSEEADTRVGVDAPAEDVVAVPSWSHDEADESEGTAGHDVVEQPPPEAPSVRPVEGARPENPKTSFPNLSSPLSPVSPRRISGWSGRPEYTKPTPTAYFRGQAGYSRFYPPDARDYKYSRHVMVAVDGTEESERAVEWSIRNLCRSGDLLHICHVSTAGDVDPRSAAYYSGPPDPRSVVDAEIGHTVDFFPAPAMSPRRRRAYDETWATKYLHRARVGRALVFVAAFLFPAARPSSHVSRLLRAERPHERLSPAARSSPHMVHLMMDPDAQDAYWAAAVLRTENMLDGIYKRLEASHGTRRFEPVIPLHARGSLLLSQPHERE